MKTKLSGLLLFAMIIPECAAARGSGGRLGDGIGGLLILVPILAVIGFGVYWLLRKTMVGKEKDKEPLLSGEALLFYALFGLMTLIASVPFILLGIFLWGAAYSNRVTTGQAVPGIVICGVISFFVARWLWRSVQSARARVAQQRIK